MLILIALRVSTSASLTAKCFRNFLKVRVLALRLKLYRAGF